MLSFLPKNPYQMQEDIKTRFRDKRKALNYTQKELSQRSGVSLGSLKRFEQSGEISLNSLLRVALVLECLEDFEKVCLPKEKMPKSIKELLDD